MNKTALVTCALVSFGSLPAYAGGMFLPFRGVRPAGRGGAFVAGADDPGALWYNPAGLAASVGREEAGKKNKAEILVDAALVGHSVSYTRVDSGGNTQPAVDDAAQLAPIPTVAAVFDVGHHLAVGLGFLAPYAALDGYPEDGAQRYALVTLHNTLLAMVEAAVAWQATESFSVGAGFQNMFVAFHSRQMFSSCPGETICAPEDPEFDAMGEIDGKQYFTPSAVLGAQLKLGKRVKLGAAFQLPFNVDMQGTIAVRLPSSGFFNGSHVEGDRADLSLTFPAMLRAGVEVSPTERWKVEAGFDWEMWSQQDEIKVTPRGVRVEDAAGVGIYDLGPFSIPRKFEDTYALRLGVEGQPAGALTVRAGYVFETGAAPDEFLTVLTPDSSKHVLSLGVGWKTGALRLDAVVSHVFMASREVAPGQSCVPIVNPIRSGEPPAMPPPGESCVHDGSPDHVYVGDGSYASSWNIFGVGMAVDF